MHDDAQFRTFASERREFIISHGQTPYWRRAHHDWRFWFGLVAMLVAIGIYVGTNDPVDGAFWPPEANGRASR